MAPRPHGAPRGMLTRMTVKMLEAIVTKFGLADLVHPYRRMRKPLLIANLSKYEKKIGAALPPPPPPPTPPPKKKSTAPKKGGPLIKASNKLVKGLSDPLYGKGTKLTDGAKKQFEQGYGTKKAPPKKKEPFSVTLPKRKAPRKRFAIEG